MMSAKPVPMATRRTRLTIARESEILKATLELLEDVGYQACGRRSRAVQHSDDLPAMAGQVGAGHRCAGGASVGPAAGPGHGVAAG